ncbi:hypothetical protein [Streptococcus parasuis]
MWIEITVLLDNASSPSRARTRTSKCSSLFGGSILAGGEQLAEAIRNKLAKTYVIVGGAGHVFDLR